MKQRIPPDVERLMWLIAESNDPQAVTDFESRFPDYRYDLAQRRRMVADLKGAKGAKSSEIPIPSFQPRAPRPAANPKQIWIAATLGLAALAVASYSITRWINTPVEKPTPPPVVKTGNNSFPDQGNVVYKPVQPSTADNHTGTAPNQAQTPVQNQEPVGEQRKTVKMSNTSLVAALKLIGAESGYNVDIAPGFQDQKVSIDYEDTTPSEILKDLGRRYAFTAFDQGDGTIIIVPAVDDGSNPPSDPNGPPRHIGG